MKPVVKVALSFVVLSAIILFAQNNGVSGVWVHLMIILTTLYWSFVLTLVIKPLYKKEGES